MSLELLLWVHVIHVANFYYISDLSGRQGRYINDFPVCYQRKIILMGQAYTMHLSRPRYYHRII